MLISASGPRIAIITMGCSPRPDLPAELLAKAGEVQCDEFGVLDGVQDSVLRENSPEHEEPRFFSPLGDGRHVVLSTRFIEARVGEIVVDIDERGYDLIVIAGTALFAPQTARTPIILGQHAVENWMAAFMTGGLSIGLIYPLPQQGDQLATFEHGTQLRGAHATVSGGHGGGLAEASAAVASADIILMHSVGYTEAMAQLVQRETGRPVVTARRIIATAIELAIAGMSRQGTTADEESYTGAELLKRLPAAETLTPREREVLAHVLEGRQNKLIAQALKISYRTVEIHRARAMAKLEAASPMDLIRRALAHGGPADL